MALSIQKILQENLPETVDNDVILLTDKGNIYVNKADGSLMKMGGASNTDVNQYYKVVYPASCTVKQDTSYDFISSTFNTRYPLTIQALCIPIGNDYSGLTLELSSISRGIVGVYTLTENEFKINEVFDFNDSITFKLINGSNGVPSVASMPSGDIGLEYSTSIFGSFGEYKDWSIGAAIKFY